LRLLSVRFGVDLPIEEANMLRLPALLIGLLLAVSSGPSRATNPAFPKPPELVPRVEFWKRIYSEVDTQSGLIHDARNLGIVYEVIRLPSGISRRSRDRATRKAKDRTKSILRTLASGKRRNLRAEEARVLALFPKGVSNRTLRTASGQVRFQLGQADKFRDGLVRMGRWENYIRQVFSARGLPSDLVALPHVESSYNPKAHSHAGASGIWQFTRSTGRRYLRVDHVVDERRDPFLATIAAARLLQANHEATKTWPLAITAYNHGGGGVNRAVRKLGTRDIATILDRYRSRTFGFASRNFYTEFLAALEVEQDFERYFGPVQKDAPEDPEIVVLDHFYRAKTLASTFGISLDALREANGALLGPIWSGQKYVPKNYGLRLPRDPQRSGSRVILARIPAGERFIEQVRDRQYRVKRGDTLSAIARRFRVRQSELMALNQLRNRNRLRVGQLLNLPVKYPQRAVARTASPNRVPEPIPANGLYRVRRGDNITEIARRFGVGTEDLLAVNHIRNRNRISVGQVLQIPGGANTARTSPAGEVSPGVYTIRRGDTLDKIARRFGVTQDAIVAQNGLRNRNQIQKGQMLYIPGGTEAAKKRAEPVAAQPGEVTQPADVAPQQAEQKEPSGGAPTPPATETTRVPEKQAPATEQQIATPASMPANGGVRPSMVPMELPLNSHRYAVRPGGTIEVQPAETLGHFADWLEIPTASLRHRNRLTFGSDLPIGTRLRLDFSRVSAKRFQERRVAHHQTLQSAFYLAYEIAGTEEYVLKRGDSLWKLSRGNRSVPVWLLREYNPDLDLGSLRAGQRLTIPKIAKRQG
jgi:membrane-bound lytic murein transglycosylase D